MRSVLLAAASSSSARSVKGMVAKDDDTSENTAREAWILSWYDISIARLYTVVSFSSSTCAPEKGASEVGGGGRACPISRLARPARLSHRPPCATPRLTYRRRFANMAREQGLTLAFQLRAHCWRSRQDTVLILPPPAAVRCPVRRAGRTRGLPSPVETTISMAYTSFSSNSASSTCMADTCGHVLAYAQPTRPAQARQSDACQGTGPRKRNAAAGVALKSTGVNGKPSHSLLELCRAAMRPCLWCWSRAFSKLTRLR